MNRGGEPAKIPLGLLKLTMPESYPSDLTDAQWELIAPMVEPRPGGRPATHPRRRIVDAILYLI